MQTKNMYGINNKRIGVERKYVTTCVTHKAEMYIDLLTFKRDCFLRLPLKVLPVRPDSVVLKLKSPLSY